MKLTVIEAGYVGLVSNVCLAEVGNDVVCLEVDQGKIKMLKSGQWSISESRVLDMLRRNVVEGRVRFTIDVNDAGMHGVVQSIAVGTPLEEDGDSELRFVLAAVRSIWRNITDKRMSGVINALHAPFQLNHGWVSITPNSDDMLEEPSRTLTNDLLQSNLCDSMRVQNQAVGYCPIGRGHARFGV